MDLSCEDILNYSYHSEKKKSLNETLYQVWGWNPGFSLEPKNNNFIYQAKVSESIVNLSYLLIRNQYHEKVVKFPSVDIFITFPGEGTESNFGFRPALGRGWDQKTSMSKLFCDSMNGKI